MVTIYALLNTLSGFAYIGCTANKMNKRLREHRCLLRAGKHAEKLLQDSWNSDSEDNFMMMALENLPVESSVSEKRDVEIKWMDNFADRGLLYNRNRTAFMPTQNAIALALAMNPNKGRKQSPEEIEKRRLKQLGKPKNHGHKISATKKLLGQKPSIEIARLGGIAACKKRYGND